MGRSPAWSESSCVGRLLLEKAGASSLIDDFVPTLTASDIAAGRTGRISHQRVAVMLYHYGPLDKTDQAAYASGVKKKFAGAVFAPDDLDRYCMVTGIVGPCRYRPDQSSH